MNPNKGQSNNSLIEKTFSNLTIFKDASFRFLYKKTERISVAIYMITNLMAVEEPIKWQLRQTSLDLLNITMSLSNTTLSLRDDLLREISKNLFQLISLYEIAYRSGFISNMNYQIVNNELVKLADFLAEYDDQDFKNRNNLFNEEFFNQHIEQIDKEQIQKDIFDKGQSIQTTSAIKDKKTFDIKDMYKGHYKRQKDKEMSLKDDKNLNNINNKRRPQNDRRNRIIDIIKQKGEVSIKDITDSIKDISEKTIQRELISMIEDGVINKEGERRWSRYMLNQQ